MLTTILSRVSTLPVREATGGRVLRTGIVYVVPPHLHGRVTIRRTISLTDGRRIKHLLSSANPLFESAGKAYGNRAIGVVLTGGGMDATDGVQAIAARGGVVIAQNESTSLHFSMPRSAIATGAVQMVLPLDEIAPTLVRLATAGPGPSTASMNAVG